MSAPSYTVCGSPAVEAKIHALVGEVGTTISREVDASRYRALVLIGGYGRGEGGVEFRDGEEHPHNNLDFLLVTRRAGPGRKGISRDRLSEALEPLRTRHGIGIDIGVISEAALRRSPCLVMWHDMRFGHRTVLGDEHFVPSLSRYSVERIPSWDVRNLLVNRGTLLIINDVLLETGHRSPQIARTVIRHVMKAIIGYGDALLYFKGRYHWSYVEKQDRMRRLAVTTHAFRQLYDTAIEFRFKPDYAEYLGHDLPSWLRDLKVVLAEVHLACERIRLGHSALGWDQYLETALRRIVFENLTSPRGLAGKLAGIVRPPIARLSVSPIASLGARAAGPRALLPVLFPFVAYGAVDSAPWKALTDAGGGSSAMRRHYLELWGQHVDLNFTFPSPAPEPSEGLQRAAA